MAWMIYSFVLVLLLISSCVAESQQERSALLSLYTSFSHPPQLIGWGSASSACEWTNVICGEDGSVNYLMLGNMSLSGMLPSAIGDLTSLRHLYLYNNQITGTIPAELGRITGLLTLYLSNNAFYGNIPDSIATLPALRLLFLGSDSLSGIVPPLLGSALQQPALQMLYLESNSFSGPLPFSTSNPSGNLTRISLSNNQFSGTLPSSYSTLTNLTALYLGNNLLEGIVPSSYGNLVNIQYLQLSNNNLAGTVPSALRSAPSLRSLFLNNNQFSGPVPSVPNTLSPSTCNLSNNRFCAPLPSNLRCISANNTCYRGPVAEDILVVIQKDSGDINIDLTVGYQDLNPAADNVTVSSVQTALWGVVIFNRNNMTATYRPPRGQFGYTFFGYEVSAIGRGLARIVRIRVNAPPVLSPSILPALVGKNSNNTSINLHLFASDPDEDNILTVASFTQPLYGGIGEVMQGMTNTTVLFTPPVDFTGVTVFNFTIQDGYGGYATGSTIVSVEDIVTSTSSSSIASSSTTLSSSTSSTSTSLSLSTSADQSSSSSSGPSLTSSSTSSTSSTSNSTGINTSSSSSNTTRTTTTGGTVISRASRLFQWKT
eukprot:TRINITY_DN9852_c0_g1_i2.p1 TRINITY_DN9852_c0_g1~~TRINITY_DN9852_c0_g1_i2.p1  ORF type:complete len:599 (+),score=93.99 TRINITY_DN9852_c0_g1_i2:60-1856(+)